MADHKTLSTEVSLKFQFFKLGFILVVVLFHSDFRYYFPLVEDLAVISTSYFFCVSAYFFYKGLDGQNIGVRLKKRCMTLLFPYLLWNMIYMILYTGIHNITFSSVIYGFTVTPLCMPSWYLLTLLIFLMPAPFIKRCFDKAYSTVAILILGILISYLGYIKFQQELAAIPVVGAYMVRMAIYFTPYLLGGIIGSRFDKKIYVSSKKCLFGRISSCVILFLFFCNIPIEIRYLLWVLFVFTLWKSVPEQIFAHVKFLDFFTEPAFTINMVHCYFLFLFGAIMTKNGYITGKYLSALTVALTLIAAYALYYLLKLLIPKTLNILTGNRIKKL